MDAIQETYERGWDRMFAKQAAEREIEQAAQWRLEAAAERGAARQVAATAPDALLSVREVAALLAMSEDFVRAHAAELGGRRVGSRLRFRRESVDTWIDAQRHDESPDAPSRRPGPRRTQAGVELLPLPGRRDTD
jgi:excisionase family DNA binding protein